MFICSSCGHRIVTMTIYLINPSHVSFGIGVITPRWLYVLASATPEHYGPPTLVDETLEPFDSAAISSGDVVGIGIHSGNALRGYELGRAARAAGAYVVFGGVHATLYPDEARDLGGAHAVVTGDGEAAWPVALHDYIKGTGQPLYKGGRIEADDVPSRPLGPAARRRDTCGPRSRPFAGARSIAPSAPSGAPTASGRGRDT